MITWGCRGKLCISILFLFPLLSLMGGASAPPGGDNMPHARSSPRFGPGGRTFHAAPMICW
uniref:Uncharacterized protein n=1 Tax=Siphoviridae sp. ctjsp22 TaxID=2825636 RepID=A0A8S5V598_9CAUD|nr:MAG TPA: hypothetical protein [Siphoviridae sp. ctjsp22]